MGKRLRVTRQRSGDVLWPRTSLAAVGQYLQYPFMFDGPDAASLGRGVSCRGVHEWHRCRETRDGWIVVVDGDELAPNLCPEDVNGDGFVSVADVLQVLGEFGCQTSCDNDVDGDDAVTVADILAILSAFGGNC